MNYSIGIDIGGTKVALAIVDENGNVREQTIIPTDLTIAPKAMIAEIIQETHALIEKSSLTEEEIIGIGIGAPGPLDNQNGMITCPPNLKTWVDVPVQKWIQQAFPYPVRLENDANAAALAEKWIGAGQENENFIYITVSTGIGAGIVADGRLLNGQKGNAGDIGHTVVDPSFGPCSCGQTGCLESIASGTAIARRGSAIMGEDLTTEEVFALYEKGHEEITDLIERVFRVLGVACVSMINTFDTEKIIIGGGVSKVGDALFQSVQGYVGQFALNPTGRQTEIVPARLEQSAGVVGAAALCFITNDDATSSLVEK
jgi:glucokinase